MIASVEAESRDAEVEAVEAVEIPALHLSEVIVETSPPPARQVVAPPPSRMPVLWGFLAGAITVLAAVGAVVMLRAPSHNSPHPAPLDPAVAQIWGGVFADTKIIGTFTNPVFLRVDKTPLYLLYKGPLTAPTGAEVDRGLNDPYIDRQLLPKDAALRFSDGWTGTGEVFATNRLTLLSGQFNRSLNLEASRSLSLNEVHGASVIFLGFPGGNGVLAEAGTANAPLYIGE